jgi:hypothetical protein
MRAGRVGWLSTEASCAHGICVAPHLRGRVRAEASVLQHVHQCRFACVVEAQEQDLGLLVVEPEHVEDAIEPAGD